MNLNLKDAITLLVFRSTSPDESPLAAVTEIVEICADLATKAGCAEAFAEVLVGEGRLLTLTPREANILILAAGAQKAANDAREGGAQ